MRVLGNRRKRVLGMSGRGCQSWREITSKCRPNLPNGDQCEAMPSPSSRWKPSSRMSSTHSLPELGMPGCHLDVTFDIRKDAVGANRLDVDVRLRGTRLSPWCLRMSTDLTAVLVSERRTTSAATRNT